nr:AlpA family phage regulatory protein [Gilvimarinus xylanilyticus]
MRVRRVCDSVGVSKTTWYKWVQEGKAPKGIRLSPGITVWRKSDIDAFIAQLIQEGGENE